MGDRRRGAAAAVAAALVTTLTALAVLLLGQVALPAGTTAIGPGRAEASCQTTLVLDGVVWVPVAPTSPVVLGDPVDGVLHAPCNDAGQGDRETRADAFRVVGLTDDYLATGTGEGQLFHRTEQVYEPAPLDARGVVDGVGIALLALVGVGLLVARLRTAKRRRHEAALPPVPSD